MSTSKVLVVEDKASNVTEASLPKDCEVTVVMSTVELVEMLKQPGWLGSFDFVLTDLFLPYENLGEWHCRVGTPPAEMPVGLILASAAAGFGIPVAICTDKNHHEDPLIELLDVIDVGEPTLSSGEFGRVIKLDAWRARVPLQESRSIRKEFDLSEVATIKDWGKVLEELVKRVDEFSENV